MAGIGAGECTPTSLNLPDGLDFDGWASRLSAAALAARGGLWWLGDCLIYGEDRWGADAASSVLGPVETACLSEGTIRAAAWVARAIPPGDRWAALSWSHHREVAALPAAVRQGWLEQAAVNGWTRAELRAALSDQKVAEALSGLSEDGWDDTWNVPDFAVAARLRFGDRQGAEVATFVQAWALRYDRGLARTLGSCS
jgi:hypothetical protein